MLRQGRTMAAGSQDHLFDSGDVTKRVLVPMASPP